MAKPPIKLALLMQCAAGLHPGSWMHNGALPGAANSIDYYTDIARLAERGLFDLFFVADTPAARTDGLEAWSRYPLFMNSFEPITLLSALAGATRGIGLGATATTSFFEPYNLARQFASLDHISGGRAAWNVVTSANAYVAKNFGLDDLPPHAERYARAREFVGIVTALWDTYEDGAVIEDKASGVYFDPAKFHVLDHAGPQFRLHGALNIARPPQGRPVIIQAGASDIGRDFAAEIAEIVFGTATDLHEAQAFYADLKGRMSKSGRTPNSMKILPGLSVVVAPTRQQAQDRHAAMAELMQPVVGKFFLGNDLEADLADLPLDEPIPAHLIPKEAKFHKAYFDQIVATIRSQNPTLRQLYMSYERGKSTMCGSATDIADRMEEWMDGKAADGFMLTFNQLPDDLVAFVDLVVPELQRRGRFRRAYEGPHLRDLLGLERPTNIYAGG
jgi:FMN-dependent oxidoreductase (nitrilotriacetate monooxygenase family)